MSERAEQSSRQESPPILSVRNLSVDFGESRAVDDLSFDLFPGEVLAIVGESGSGKSVTSLAIMRLLEQSSIGTINQGSITLRRRGGDELDLARASERTMRELRGNEISMIFQEPLTALNPLLRVGDQIGETLRVHRGMGRKEARLRALELMQTVRIPEPERRLRQYPHEMSGGMRQRVMTAMALACEPAVFIADEPTTALDVTIQAQILSLIVDMRDRLGTSIIFITHDMGVVAEVADRVLVMCRSKFVEQGTVEQVFAAPREAYTRGLLRAVPRLGSMEGYDEPQPFPLSEGATT